MKKKNISIVIIIIMCVFFEIMYHMNSYSEGAEIQMPSFGVSLLENDEIIAYRLGNDVLYGEINFDGLEIGKDIKKNIAVKNYGLAGQFVRIIITRYWFDKNGKKSDNIDPNFIELKLTGDENWLVPEEQKTPERMIAYYKKAIEYDEKTSNFIDSVKISPDIYDYGYTISEDDNGNIAVDYNISGFNMDIEVDAVQDHYAKDAIKSAWGIDVEISEDGSTILEIY